MLWGDEKHVRRQTAANGQRLTRLHHHGNTPVLAAVAAHAEANPPRVRASIRVRISRSGQGCPPFERGGDLLE